MSAFERKENMSYLQIGFERRLADYLFSERRLGILIILLSAASFGAVTPFARLAYDEGVTVITIMVVPYALTSGAVMGYLTWYRQPWRLTGRGLLLTLGIALFLGLTLFAYLDSVQYIPVSLAALIYYTYPIMVALLTHLINGHTLAVGDRNAHVLAF